MLGSRRVKPSVYLSPTAQPISRNPAMIRMIHAIMLFSHEDLSVITSDAKCLFVPA